MCWNDCQILAVVFNTTFDDISVLLLWSVLLMWSVLLVKENRVFGKNQRPAINSLTNFITQACIQYKSQQTDSSIIDHWHWKPMYMLRFNHHTIMDTTVPCLIEVLFSKRLMYYLTIQLFTNKLMQIFIRQWIYKYIFSQTLLIFM